MESQPNFPQPEQLSYHPKHHIKVYVWIALVVAALLVAINAYLYFLRLSYLEYGFNIHQEEEQVIRGLRELRLKYNEGSKVYRNRFKNYSQSIEIYYPNARWSLADSSTQDTIYIFLGTSVDSTNPWGIADPPWPGLEISTEEGKIYFDRNQTRTFQESRKFEFTDHLATSIKFVEGGKMIYAQCAFYSDHEILDACNQIISTFKFIDTKVDIDDWIAYRSDQYNFEFKYHPDLKIVECPAKKISVIGKTSGYLVIPYGIYVLPSNNVTNNTIKCYDTPSSSIALTVRENDPLSFEDYCRDPISASVEVEKSLEKIIISGKPAHLCQLADTLWGRTYYVNKIIIETENLDIVLKNVFYEPDYYNKLIFDQILSTFRFLE